jgi:putative membrane protein
MIKEALAIAGCVLLAIGCSDKRSNTSTHGTAANRSGAGTTEAGANRKDTGRATEAGAAKTTQVDANDRRFVQEAASGDLFEIQSSQLASTKLAGTPHAQFAQQMTTDHGKTSQELSQIAQRKGIEVPTQMLAKHQQMLDKLRDASDFETAYHDAQLQAHKDSVAMYEEASRNLADRDLREFATRTLPTLRHHLEELQSHQESTNGEKSKGSDAGDEDSEAH